MPLDQCLTSRAPGRRESSCLPHCDLHGQLVKCHHERAHIRSQGAARPAHARQSLSGRAAEPGGPPLQPPGGQGPWGGGGGRPRPSPPPDAWGAGGLHPHLRPLPASPLPPCWKLPPPLTGPNTDTGGPRAPRTAVSLPGRSGGKQDTHGQERLVRCARTLTNGNQKHSANNGVLCRCDDPDMCSPLCFPLVPSSGGARRTGPGPFPASGQPPRAQALW